MLKCIKYNLQRKFLVTVLFALCVLCINAQQSTYTINSGFSGDDNLIEEEDNSSSGRWAKRDIYYDNFEFYCSKWKGSNTTGSVGCIRFRWGNNGYFCLTQEKDTGKFRLKRKNSNSGNSTNQLAYYDGPNNAQPSVKIICVGQNIIVEIDGTERMNVTHTYDYSGEFAFWKSNRWNDGNEWHNITMVEVPIGLWTGAVSTDFHDADNWSGSILPTASDDIIIPDVTNQPVVTTSVSVNAIDVYSGADITISSGTLSIADSTDMDGTLIIESGAIYDANGDFDATGGDVTFTGAGTLQVSHATITSFGSLTSTVGTIAFDGAGAQNIPAGTYYSLDINESGTKSITGDITVNGDITLTDGELDLNGNHDLYLKGDLSKTNGALVNSSSSNGYLILEATSSENLSQAICGFTAPSISIKKINSGNAEISGDISANYIWLQSANSGTFTIDNNYNLDVDDKIVVSGGTLNILSGSLSTSKNSSSAHELTGGTLDIDGGTVSFGSSSNTTADLNIDGGALDISGGTLNVSDCIDIETGTFTQTGGVVNVKTYTSGNGDSDHKFAMDAGTLNLTGGTMNLLDEHEDADHYSMYISSGVTTASNVAHTINILTNDASNDEDRYIDFGDASNAIGNLTFDLTSHELYFKSNADILGDLTATNGDIDVSSYTVNVTGNAEFTNDDLLISTGILDVDGTFNAPNNITFSGTGRLQLSGTVSSLGTMTNSVGTVEYDANGNQNVLADTYFSLEIDGSGTKTLPTSNITVNGDLTISAGTLEYNSGSSDKQITLKGSMSGSGTITASTSSIFKIDGDGTNQDICCISSDDIGIQLDDLANATTSGDISCKYLDLLSGSTGTFTIDGETFTINNTDGYLEMEGGNLTVSAGSLIVHSTSETKNELDAGILTVSGGSVTFTGNNSSTRGDLNIDGGTLSVSSGSISMNDELDVGTGTINQTGGAIYVDAGTDSNNGTSANKFDMDAGSLNLSGGTLYFQGQSNSSYKCIDIASAVSTSITSAHTIDIGTNSTPKDMYIAMNGHAIGNLTVNLSGKSTFLTGDLDIQGAVNVIDGLLNLDLYNVNVSGATSIGGTLQIGSGQYDADGTFDASSGSIDFTNSSGELYVSTPSVTSFGSLDDALGTVIFDGSSAQTISEAETFYSLKIDNTSGVTMNAAIDVNGTLNMNAGNIINSNNILTIGSSSGEGSINHTSGIVTGALRQYFPNSVGSKFFPVGNSTILRDITLDFTSAPGTNQYLTASYNPGKPQGSNGSDLYTGLPLTTSDGQYIEDYDDEGYWEIIPGSSSLGDSYSADINSAPYNVSIHCNNLTADDGVSPIDRTKVRVIKSPGPSHSTWESPTPGSITGSDDDFILTASGTGFSFFGAGKGPENSPLPVELVGFSGVCSDGIVHLEWLTASEHNSEDFEVEYSRDGIDWSLIHIEQSAGFSNSLLTYNYEHTQAIIGNNYYRLIQNDTDGNSVIYDNVIINVSCQSADKEYFSVFPNPGSGSFQAVINNSEIEGQASLRILDTKGGLVVAKLIEVNSGINMFVINQNLSSGIYYIYIDDGSIKTRVVKYCVR